MPADKIIRIVDSHTGGEPTRVVLTGGPDLGTGPLNERLRKFKDEFDHFRSAIVNEPRGSDAIVGALLCEPVDPTCSAGVIFFNNTGYLGMCGHGTIGLAVTLAHYGRIERGIHRIETPVGIVQAELHDAEHVTVHNVPSFRTASGIAVAVEQFGMVTGDIAWGGNWFFVAHENPLEIRLSNLEALTDLCWSIRRALNANGITAPDGSEIDHVELYGPPTIPGANSKNFVLCPGGSYDRSPCGTGTSAKLACLYESGNLEPGQRWVQESIIGSLFEGSIHVDDGGIYPRIMGSAYVIAESSLFIQDKDPLRWGIRECQPTQVRQPG